MKKLFFFGLTALLIIACSNAGSNGEGDETAGTSSQPTAAAASPNGEKIYKQYCVTCHGLYGDMGASGAYNLTESELAVEERVNVITNGRKTMSAFKNLLDEDEIQAVAEYTMELKKDN